ncbi:BolA family protein [Celerinatantimonas diazotrophica]|uniref:DNA-binding transcriptional regulator BolA n=1 Tax=Celerinatantimonas diazotrophica TaxID=412034 RepID=A0A4R1K6J3_9GAMM|nr:BolA/IbaG family iron-sulfur metabolism protein [Celerinatantimonas diazotrophica]TCK58669.1 BolA protein family transcriptional regulator [Celerinatantimonas diazotrophica]CAG9297298.1 DNA-binding transcriptional regulator BolA [Celerinatantimonas diazotrophica]
MSVAELLENKLREQFCVNFLQVVNESHRHHVPRGSESHFKVTLVSEAFAGQKLIARHRLVNECLNELLEGPIHALALHTYTPEEWQKRAGEAPKTPNCVGS